MVVRFPGGLGWGASLGDRPPGGEGDPSFLWGGGEDMCHMGVYGADDLFLHFCCTHPIILVSLLQFLPFPLSEVATR